MPRGTPYARIPLRLDPDDLDAAERAAEAEDTDRSTILRRWISRGRDAEEHPARQSHAQQPQAPKPPRRPATPAHRVEITPRQARSLSKSEQVTRRDR
jgi:hypothetical protein